MQLVDFILTALISVFFTLLIDKLWMKNLTKVAKFEKGIKFIEHYHIGIILVTLGIITYHYAYILPSIALIPAGFTLIICELKQKNAFALTSNHAKLSSIIGIILAVLTMIIYFLFRF